MRSQSASPVYFLLFSSSNQANPVVNDIQFPKYLGMGLLKLREDECNELFISFSKAYSSHFNTTLNIPGTFNLTHRIREYIISLTSGHVGQTVEFLNSLYSTLFSKQLKSHCDYNQKNSMDEIWLENIILSWYRSYQFYSFICVCRAAPKFEFTMEERKTVQEMLMHSILHPSSPHIRLRDNILTSLCGKRIMRNADETLLGEGMETSVGLDATFTSPLIAHLILQNTVQESPTNGNTTLESSINILQAIQAINPMELHTSVNPQAATPYLFCLEFYKSLSSLFPMSTFTSVHLHSIPSGSKKIFSLMDIYISDEVNSHCIVLCQNTVAITTTQWNGYQKHAESSLYIPKPTNTTYICCSYPSIIPGDVDNFSNNIIQVQIMNDVSGVSVVGKDCTAQNIIFSGHIAMRGYPTPVNIMASLSPVVHSPRTSNIPGTPGLIHESEVVKLFVGQIPRTFDENSLRDMFETYGDLYEIGIIRDKRTGNHSGSAFVSYLSPTSAEQAIQNLHGIHTFPGQNRPMQIKLADSKQSKDGKKIYNCNTG